MPCKVTRCVLFAETSCVGVCVPTIIRSRTIASSFCLPTRLATFITAFHFTREYGIHPGGNQARKTPRFLRQCQPTSKNCCFPPQRVACTWGGRAAAAPGLAREALKIQAFPYHLRRGKVWHLHCIFP